MTHEDEQLLAMFRAAEDRAARCTLPIVCDYREQTAVLGTCTLFEIPEADRCYLISAKHVLDAADEGVKSVGEEYQFGVPESCNPTTNCRFFGLTGRLIRGSHSTESNDRLDLAAFLLTEPDMIARLRETWQPLTLD